MLQKLEEASRLIRRANEGNERLDEALDLIEEVITVIEDLPFE